MSAFLPAAVAAVAGTLRAGSGLSSPFVPMLFLLGVCIAAAHAPANAAAGTQCLRRWAHLLLITCCGFAVGTASHQAGMSFSVTRVPIPDHQAIRLVGTVDSIRARGDDHLAELDLARAAGPSIEGSASGRARVIFAGRHVPSAGTGVAVRFPGDGSALWRDERGGLWVRAHEWQPEPELDAPTIGFRGDTRGRLRESAMTVAGGASPLLVALLLGDGSDVDPRLELLFRRSGTIHLLALSGMHLGILALLVRLVARRFAGPRCAAWISVVVGFAYLALVGPRPGLVRAASLVTLAALARMLDRDRPLVELLAVVCLVQLLTQPGIAASIGFQLSYLSLLGIGALAGPLSERLSRWVPPTIASPLSAGLGAQLMTTPLLLLRFEAWYPIGIVATVVMGPLVVLFMSVGLLAVLCELAGIAAVSIVSVPLLEALGSGAERLGWFFSGAPAVRPTVLAGWIGGTLAVGAAALLGGLHAQYGRPG